MADVTDSCPKCKTSASRIVWNADSVLRLTANLLLLPVWFLIGFFGDPRGAYLSLRRECLACGTRFASARFLRMGRQRRSTSTI